MRNIRTIIGRTNKTLTDQGYAYNQAGLTYNQIGVMYGGISGQDIPPLVNQAKLIKPVNIVTGDIGS